jgi:uncharacterized RDD family membrane protein YckC
MDTTLSAPPPGAPPAALPSGPPPPQPPNRKELDSKRVLARLIDLFIAGAPPAVLAADTGRGLSTLLISLVLAYYFLCEALWGQTIGKRVLGLRVLMRDGRAATVSAVSARTILRIIEDSPLGLIVMLLSGRRRQRLGDLLGGTIVAEARPGVPDPPFSPMLFVYPVAWTIGAIVFALQAQPSREYVTAVDTVCRHRQEAFVAQRGELTLNRVVTWIHADHRVLEEIKAPSGSEGLRREVLALDGELLDRLDQAIARARASRDPVRMFRQEIVLLEARRLQIAHRFAELGMPDCIGVPA